MANKNRVSGRNSRGSNHLELEGEQTMSEQLQSENEQTSIEAEDIQVHEDTGQEQAQQDEEVSVQEEPAPTEAANENLEEKPIIHKEQEIVADLNDGKLQQVILNEANIQELQPESNDGKEESSLAIEDIVKPGKFGVTNSQMIPAIKQVIAVGSVEKLRLLRSIYLYSFENSLRYLKKSEREFIQNNLK
ncbi:hypothetical protein H70357_22005 [Paenibacillus sp. FSL H7-0357]|uniref:hypothetical protein n=1 Tax=Paenibacillus sp. FSL H7-0357 TaxID=1536774 RepID=UPI0004F8C46F|nr:hypothetical protein [Paenibacillus sp. FSL H7-0357]AIQ19084.1 hypothetical protein H70357_22005 [Paenibacillus sp. FSL H7-0357]